VRKPIAKKVTDYS